MEDPRSPASGGAVFLSLKAFDIVFLAGFVAYIVIRGAFEERTKNIKRPISRFDW